MIFEELNIGLSFFIVLLIIFFFVEGVDLLLDCLQTSLDPKLFYGYLSRYSDFSSGLRIMTIGLSLSNSTLMRFYCIWLRLSLLVWLFSAIKWEISDYYSYSWIDGGLLFDFFQLFGVMFDFARPSSFLLLLEKSLFYPSKWLFNRAIYILGHILNNN